jgi:hypothetical protein
MREVRFAGGLWGVGAESGVTLAVFEGDGLTATRLGAFYEAGARQGTKITALTTGTPTIDGRPGYRLDVTNDGRLETIVTNRMAPISTAKRAIRPFEEPYRRMWSTSVIRPRLP